ncbi:MAG TPA: carboxymuconolactone decarboxylase family protein [Streptosporangiaceae bacterium]|jgi:AhpD family alkylhydroperoxidase
MDLKSLAPRVYKAMLALDAAAGEGLEPPLKELVRVRASQLNGCVYCIDMHSTDARTGGESEQRLYALPAWPEAPYFTERERAALALTDAVTLLSETHVPDDVYDLAAKHFDQPELAQLISLILTINAWNRIGVTCRLEPGT